MFGSTVRAFLEGAVERLEFPGRAHLVDRLVGGGDRGQGAVKRDLVWRDPGIQFHILRQPEPRPFGQIGCGARSRNPEAMR